MKMAALTAVMAAPESVAPAPPHSALSMICPPCLVSEYIHTTLEFSHLGVTDEHDLSARALLVIRSDSVNHRSSALLRRAIVAYTTAGRLTSASWVHDGLRSRTRVGGFHLVDETTGSTIPSRSGSLTGTEDVNLRAALSLFNFGSSQASQRKGSGSGELHVGGMNVSVSDVEIVLED